MKYAWIERYRARWPVAVMCPVLGVSLSGYYQQRRRPPTLRVPDAAVLVHIRAAQRESKGE